MTVSDSLNISSPGYPAFYQDNLDYSWYITAPDNGTFLIEFKELLLMTKRPELYVDSLTIGVGDISGENTALRETHFFPVGTTIMIYTSSLWLRLQSDAKKYRQKGFMAEITRIRKKSE